MKLARTLLAALAFSSAVVSFAKPPEQSFDWINLVSDIDGVARRTDANLVNPWGLVIAPNGAIWVADNGTGAATVYDSRGRPLPSETNPLVVAVPTASAGGGGAALTSLETSDGKPTGEVFNPTSNFVISQGGRSGKAIFIFAGEDGTISGWNPAVDPTHAVLAADRSSTRAVYKGLALGGTGGSSFLYAANFYAGTVDIFDKNFAFVAKPGAFHDPSLPAGFAPFGIQNIQNLLFVSYAKQDADAEDDVAGPGNGFIDIFDLQGNFLRRFASQGALNSPWGMVLAPHKFGKFEHALLVGNFGDGRINAFDRASGAFLGQLSNSDGRPLAFDGLWGLAFSGDSLFFTAGIAHEDHGLFGVITRTKHDGD